MKKRFDLLIFDWDGTLVDSVDWIVHCIQQAAIKCQLMPPEAQAIKDIIGLSIENAMLRLFPGIDDPTRLQLAEYYGCTFASKQIGQSDLFPGVHTMLRQFKKRGYRLAIATGKKSSGLGKATAATETADLFNATRCSDQTASKPDPQMINEIVNELNVDRRRTLMIGDSVHDLQMAINAGVSAVGLTCGAHSAKTLQHYRPLMCLNYPTDLLEFL